MTRDNYRTIGAITGIVMGVGSMHLLGLNGLLPGFFFGAGGAVAGGIAGEQFFAWRQKGR